MKHARQGASPYYWMVVLTAAVAAILIGALAFPMDAHSRLLRRDFSDIKASVDAANAENVRYAKQRALMRNETRRVESEAHYAAIRWEQQEAKRKAEAEAIVAEHERIKAEEEAERIAAEQALAAQEAAYWASQQYYAPSYETTADTPNAGSVDLRSAGVVYQDGTRFTWYSQNVLPGGGLTELNNSGRTVDNRGFVTDGDGYIAVASSDHAQGTVVSTPYGAGKVYDSGCASGTIDIYTSW